MNHMIRLPDVFYLIFLWQCDAYIADTILYREFQCGLRFLFVEAENKEKYVRMIGVAPVKQLRTCVIKNVTFKRGHLM